MSFSAPLSVIRMSAGPPVQECPEGYLLGKEQIKTCHISVRISESSQAESGDSHQCTTSVCYNPIISMHDWLGEVIAQPLIQTPGGLFLNLILSEKKNKKKTN